MFVLLVGGDATAAPKTQPAPTAPALTKEEKVAQEFLDKGQAAYEAGDFETARLAFQRTVEMVPNKPNPHRWLGLTDAKLGRCAEAIASLERFLSLVTSQDPRTVEATVIRDRCLAELAPKVGTLMVSSDPDGAEVRLNDRRGEILGATPWRTTTVQAGSHVLYLSKRGFAEVSRTFEMRADQTLDLAVQLRALAPPPRAPARSRSTTKYWVGGGVVLVAAAIGTALLITSQSDPMTALPPVVAP